MMTANIPCRVSSSSIMRRNFHLVIFCYLIIRTALFAEHFLKFSQQLLCFDAINVRRWHCLTFLVLPSADVQYIGSLLRNVCLFSVVFASVLAANSGPTHTPVGIVYYHSALRIYISPFSLPKFLRQQKKHTSITMRARHLYFFFAAAAGSPPPHPPLIACVVVNFSIDSSAKR